MSTKTKTLLTTLLLFFIATGVMAQEKYEYATVKLEIVAVGKCSIFLSTEDNEYKEIPVTFSSTDRVIANYNNSAPALKWIKENGWEIVEFHPKAEGKLSIDFLVRKKKS